MFDIWSKSKIFPFLFFQNHLDNIIGLEDRMELWFRGKARLFKGFSVSYAFLFEREDYLDYSFDSTLVVDTSMYSMMLNGKMVFGLMGFNRCRPK